MDEELKKKEELFDQIKAHMIETNIRLEQLDKIEHQLCGNGEPGLLIRVDRLEQAARWFIKVVGTLGLVVIGLVGNALIRLI